MRINVNGTFCPEGCGSFLPLAISVATLWLMSVGGEVDAEIPDSTIPDILCYLPQTRGKRSV